VSWSLWLALLGAAVLISLTPGAGAINTMANSIRSGWARSMWGIAGQQVALLVHIAVVAAGLGALVRSSALLFDVLRYAGAAYLVYLGVRQLRSRPQAQDGGDSPGGDRSPWSMVRRGLFVNLTNPKAVVFFLAFTPQFVDPARPLLAQYLVFAATVVVVDVVVMWCVFAVAARGLRRITATARGQRRLNRVFGALFVGVGAALAGTH